MYLKNVVIFESSCDSNRRGCRKDVYEVFVGNVVQFDSMIYQAGRLLSFNVIRCEVMVFTLWNDQRVPPSERIDIQERITAH